ncbi:MAG: EF-Tu/IF-2/RF-3 family GTPase, partial [Akkermansia sp.]
NADPNGDFQMLVSNIDWDDYVGRVAVGRITSGSIEKGDNVWIVRQDGTRQPAKITRLFEYSGLGSTDSIKGIAGNIVGISGFEEVNIGETINGSETAEALPFVAIDPPTISMEFSINNGPFGGRDGKNVTSRVIRDRLIREMRTNVSIQVEDTDKAGVFTVSARGAMQIAVLVETMRRENYEVCVSRPTVIMKRDAKDHLLEPFETLYVEVPDEFANGVMKLLLARKGLMEDMVCKEGTGRTFIQAYIPTRGVIGFEFELVNLTSGHGLFSHLFRDYAPYAGDITTRQTGTLVSMETGVSTPFALVLLEERGRLFVGTQEDIYEGQIVGENPRTKDMPVNPCREKQLNNIRSANKGDGIHLSPPVNFSLERAIEYIEADELVEATPHFIRLRKRILNASQRQRADKKAD